MNEPFFLSIADVEYLHEQSILRHGGTGGVRDPAGLAAAVNHPKHVLIGLAEKRFTKADFAVLLRTQSRADRTE